MFVSVCVSVCKRVRECMCDCVHLQVHVCKVCGGMCAALQKYMRKSARVGTTHQEELAAKVKEHTTENVFYHQNSTSSPFLREKASDPVPWSSPYGF